METKTRNSRPPKPDERNRISVRVGGRDDHKVFKFPSSVSSKEIESRKARLKELYEACGGWNEFSLTVAKSVHHGVIPVPLPPREMIEVFGVKYDGVVHFRRTLVSRLPSIPWAELDETWANAGVLGGIKHLKMKEIDEAAKVISEVDGRQLTVVQPIAGSLHEAMDAYDAQVKKDEPKNHDRHSKIKQLRNRHSDQPLAALGIDSCKALIGYWRQRPHRHDGKGQYSPKRSREQLGELDRFFEWLHLSEQFQWREPEDLNRVDRSIYKDGLARKSVLDSKMPTFSLDDLASLVRNAELADRLWITWCLNNSHGAAEVGRVQWEDVFLNQDHPWKSQGLEIWEGGNWIGFLRPKTDVLGWWLLWDETVELLKQWKDDCAKALGRSVKATDRIILTETGKPLYRDDSKNAQSGFATHFSKLKSKCAKNGSSVKNLPAGTLRNQFSDWCGGEQADALVASVGLAHGIPHKGDKLLFKHYSNKPWKKLFEKQLEFRDHCKPVLDALRQVDADAQKCDDKPD